LDEQWLNESLLSANRKKKKAQESLQQIIKFKLKIENTVSNFSGTNHLLPVWALEKLGRKKSVDG